MKLSYFPQVKVVHTSKIFHGQLYVPFLNWLLMLGTVLAAAIYNNVCNSLLPLETTQLTRTSDNFPRKRLRVTSPSSLLLLSTS